MKKLRIIKEFALDLPSEDEAKHIENRIWEIANVDTDPVKRIILGLSGFPDEQISFFMMRSMTGVRILTRHEIT